MIWNIIFYGIIIVVGITVIAVTIYRIDWARHPEKYKKDLENLEKEEYWKKKKADQEAAVKKAKAKQKDRKKQARMDKINEYRASGGKLPKGLEQKMNQANKAQKNKKK